MTSSILFAAVTATSATKTLQISPPPPPKLILSPPQDTQTKEEREAAFYRKRETRVNPYKYHIVVQPWTMCANNTFMVILVHSHHPHADRRAAIRDTWASYVRDPTAWPAAAAAAAAGGLTLAGRAATVRLKLAFVFGLHKDPGMNDLVREENQRYDDVIQGDFFDAYSNMTLKSLLGLKYVSERCPAVRYLLKCDDDMFINVPYLVDALLQRPLNRSVLGPLNLGSRVYRNGKWKLTMAEYPFETYPPYESGAAYVISGDVIGELFAVAEYVPPIHIDDVYVTGILGRIIGLQHERRMGFAYWTDRAPDACDVIHNRIFSGTKMLPETMRSMWEELKRGKTCPVSETS